jgi:CheY-like chemotaxis protein
VNRNYLLIDDNEAFADNLAEILRDCGAEVDVCTEGGAALERVKARRYDAVVTDMKMPGMNGAELLHELRKVDAGVPALLLSAFSHEELLAMARRDGVLAALSKPQQIPDLLRLLGAARRDGAVLLVEDDVALADNLAEALSARGLTAVTAHSARELKRVSARPFAVLVDLKLPDAGFGEALEHVRRQWPGVPVVVMTAFANEATLGETAALFQKPFDTAKVLARLEALYEECHAA